MWHLSSHNLVSDEPLTEPAAYLVNLDLEFNSQVPVASFESHVMLYALDILKIGRGIWGTVASILTKALVKR